MKAKMNLMPCLAAKNQRNHHNPPQYPQLKNPPNQVTTKVPCLATRLAHLLRPKRPLQRPKLHQRPKLRPKNRPPRPKTATTQAARRMILMLKWTVDPTQISRYVKTFVKIFCFCLYLGYWQPYFYTGLNKNSIRLTVAAFMLLGQFDRIFFDFSPHG